ncbi:hypothetical protein [Micromonospora fluostatini]|uniref:hypothetical protein n=1 Tax=Micromonospora sp. JCM 30529 TaxID=3421643 RepID=UPI003D1650DC
MDIGSPVDVSADRYRNRTVIIRPVGPPGALHGDARVLLPKLVDLAPGTGARVTTGTADLLIVGAPEGPPLLRQPPGGLVSSALPGNASGFTVTPVRYVPTGSAVRQPRVRPVPAGPRQNHRRPMVLQGHLRQHAESPPTTHDADEADRPSGS